MSSDNKGLNANGIVYATIMVREERLWHRWVKALYKKHQYDKNNTSEKNVNIKQKLAKSTHKWPLKKHITFGEIRKRLGEYYSINPYNIEIWIQDKTKQWAYDSKSRGLWDKQIGSRSLLQDSFNNQYMFMKFEIVAYNTIDFDKMISDQKDKAISQLAMFDFDFYTPNDSVFDSKSPLRMTIIHKKNWKAKEIISTIIKYCLDNPIYGYVYFKDILKYMRNNSTKFEIQSLAQLKPQQFVICEEQKNKAPSTWRLNQTFKMPTHFSQIFYTRFQLLFLNCNDPMADKSELKSLWVCFQGEKYMNNICCRILIQKDQTLKDIVNNQILKHLETINNKYKLIPCVLSYPNILKLIHFDLSGHYGKFSFDMNMYDNINNKSRLLVKLPPISEIKLLTTSPELSLNSIQMIVDHCQFYQYNEPPILHIWTFETIQNAIDWMDNRILYNVNAIDYNRIAATMLMLRYNIYCGRSSGDIDHIPLSTPLNGTSILKLDDILFNGNCATDIDLAVRVWYAWYISQRPITVSNNIMVIKNIFQFQLWLLKLKCASKILVPLATAKSMQRLNISMFKTDVVVTFAENLWDINCSDPQIIKYCMDQLWDCLNHVTMINWKENYFFTAVISSLWDVENDSCKVTASIIAMQYCYQLLKWDLNDCKKKLLKLIYRIDHEKLRLRLIKLLNRKTPLKIRSVNKDQNSSKYNHSNWFETKSKILCLKQMVKGIKCEWCNEHRKKLRICNGCKNIWYCCRKHQKLDWNKNHRTVCGK